MASEDVSVSVSSNNSDAMTVVVPEDPVVAMDVTASPVSTVYDDANKKKRKNIITAEMAVDALLTANVGTLGKVAFG
ncbi:unnamed protein product [marine sediment metagenome]|uniref:Uncharacterized protein n=1 Tax=marine sediment metagenome TaxID=412755 RepID=X0ZG68_9ZZZZ